MDDRYDDIGGSGARILWGRVAFYGLSMVLMLALGWWLGADRGLQTELREAELRVERLSEEVMALRQENHALSAGGSARRQAASGATSARAETDEPDAEAEADAEDAEAEADAEDAEAEADAEDAEADTDADADADADTDAEDAEDAEPETDAEDADAASASDPEPEEGPAAEDGEPASDDESEKEQDAAVYKVREGDTGADIARTFYGDDEMWAVIRDANGLRADEVLHVGQRLKIPADG